MVEPVKTILLVDLDGLGRSLAASGGEGTDERLAEHIADWSGAIESGELIEPAGTLRAIVMRRCYVGSASADQPRAAFVNAGFEMVECDGQAQVELTLAIDAMEAAADADGERDFILLTAAPDLTPLAERLRARGHRVAVYVSAVTAAGYEAAADMTLPADAFSAFLSESQVPQPAAISPADRAKIEGFAREVHAATNIPMFSPRTFADLFRILADEVAQNGYHFNDTAKNVAERLNDAGRNVTSRQVVFVVKGLALKGHVFSTNDTPERLAEVFREQARYLIGNAGISLDGYREALLGAWIAAPQSQPGRPAKPAAAEKPVAERPAEKPAAERPAAKAAAPKPAPVKPPPSREPDQQPPAREPEKPEPVREPQKPAPVREPEKPPRRAEKAVAAKPAPAPPRVPERPKSAALPAKPPVPPEEPPAPARPGSTDLRTTIAARIAASAKMKPAARPAQRSEAPAPPPPRAPIPLAVPVADSDTIESSILAAIAEAVDVLVEDGGGDQQDGRRPAPRRDSGPSAERRQPPERPAQTRPEADTPPPPPPEVEEAEEGSGDIGDEIQRIVASYNRNREEDDRR